MVWFARYFDNYLAWHDKKQVCHLFARNSTLWYFKLRGERREWQRFDLSFFMQRRWWSSFYFVHYYEEKPKQQKATVYQSPKFHYCLQYCQLHRKRRKIAYQLFYFYWQFERISLSHNSKTCFWSFFLESTTIRSLLSVGYTTAYLCW